uniref:Protein croquemort n=1 Tax=Steinernema glaseri TaxID=37863 RepID=A0A1I8A493_9BILA
MGAQFHTSLLPTYLTLSSPRWSPPENLTRCTDDLKKQASQLNGTMGQFFHVQLKKSETPYVYVDDICRSLRLVYDSEVTVRDVAGLRFVIDASTFDYAQPGNCGFCTRLDSDFYDRPAGSFCLPDGLLDLGGCKPMPLKLPDSVSSFIHLIKLPIVASNPHFYGADPEVIDLFPRFRPSKEEDLTALDIEPQTGTLLRANKRLQMSILFRRFPDVSSFSNILPGAYPMFWVNETYTIDDSSWRSLHGSVLGTKRTVELVCYIVGVGFGALLVVLSLVSCFVSICCVHRHQEPREPRVDSKFEELPSAAIRADSTVQLRARPIRRKD